MTTYWYEIAEIFSWDKYVDKTYFSGAINVVNAEDRTEAVQQDFSERWHQLCRSYQHVNTRRSDKTRITHIYQFSSIQ